MGKTGEQPAEITGIIEAPAYEAGAAALQGKTTKVISYDLSMSELKLRLHLRAIFLDIKDKKDIKEKKAAQSRSQHPH